MSNSVKTLTVSIIVETLDRFLYGELSAQELEAWADHIECNDDFEFDEADQDLIDNIIFRIANPCINEALTAESITKMRSALLTGRIQ